MLEAAEPEEVTPEPKFQQLHLTCPDGLTLNFGLESSRGVRGERQSLLVKQSYPFKTTGKHK